MRDRRNNKVVSFLHYEIVKYCLKVNYNNKMAKIISRTICKKLTQRGGARKQKKKNWNFENIQFTEKKTKNSNETEVK